MASFSGFIRKSPSDRLRRFLKARGVDVPEGFDWTSEGRGTDLVRSVEGLLEELPDRQQDAVKAELELLASLSDDNGMTGAVQVCAGQGIDLEGLEGVQDVLLMLATQHPRMIDRVNVQASLMRRHGGKQWARFQFPDDGKPWVLDRQSAREGFLKDTVEILDLPDHRKREAEWYQSIRISPLTGEETKLKDTCQVGTDADRQTRSQRNHANGTGKPIERVSVVCRTFGASWTAPGPRFIEAQPFLRVNFVVCMVRTVWNCTDKPSIRISSS